MGTNSKRRREEKLRKKAKNNSNPNFRRSHALDAKLALTEFETLITNLTTPKSITEKVLEFSRTLSDQVPFYIDCQPEPWSRQNCCDRNVVEYAKIHGGEPVFGFRLWANGDIYIEAERHAIWKGNEELRDVSFVSSGETHVLFVPDSQNVTGGFDAAPQKIRYAFTPHRRQVIATINALESAAPIGQMTSEESWRVMPTYAQWQNGKRMPNYVPVHLLGGP
ncbi:hypothetical protein DFR29_103170 [Tahibacter aquaticus]|uniref:Uncharacterized protein n=1 Tax=Tahibacter aquaticus TaxID=520092 RepID=A0A4R6Z4N1_9GAMM|nr:hypothetical protein [Tahibacter aquaticus]TDR46635.1 hypothetical protein DFR29_103170 [Tahibacter aquaticus]